MKKKHLHAFLLVCLLLSGLQGFSQTITKTFFGQNAWMPDTIGDYKNCNVTTCYRGGKLHKKWGDIQASGAGSIRFGGMAPDRDRPTNYQYIKMIDSIRTRGMEPIMQVPFHNFRYSASQAADIVKYVNITKGRNIKYWIIANEPNLEYGYTSSSQVAKYIKSFSSAMRDVDPSILIIGPELAGYVNTIITGLTTAGGPDDITGRDAKGRYYIDYFSFHNYPMGDSDPLPTRAEVIARLTSSGQFQDDLTSLNKRLAACNSYHGRSGIDSVKTAVTEANINYDNPSSDGLYSVGAQSFIGGQFWAEMMGIAMKKGVSIINFWSVVEGNNTITDKGFISNSTGKRRSSFYHFKMMAENFSGDYATSTDNQTNVKTFASKSGNQVTVMIMNQESSTDHNYTVRLNNSTVSGTDALKINVNAGINKEYTGVINDQSSTVLVFDLAGNLKKRVEYKLNGNADMDLPPTTTTYSTTNTITATIAPVGSTKICAGGSVVLNANTGSGYSYQWKKDGINISGATSSSYTAVAAGNYSVTVSNGSSSATSASTSVTIATATITAGGSTTICAGSNVVLTANSGTGYTYQWKKDNIAIAYGTGVSYTATTSGAYSVTINNSGCSMTSTATNVTVNTAMAKITNTVASFVAGTNLLLTAQTGTGYIYQWKKDGANIAGATAATYLATAAGSYQLKVTVGTCNDWSAPLVVTTTATKIIAAITPAGPATICSDSTLTMNANSGTGYTYQWKKDGVNISGATTATYKTNTAGSYTVSVTSNGTTATSAATTVAVNNPVAKITASGSTTFIKGGSVILNAQTGTGYTYQWKKDNVNISGATAASYTASIGGSYSVVAKSGTCDNISSPVVVTVTSPITATVSPFGTITVCSGTSTKLSANTGTGYTYQWKKDSVNISGATASTYTATTSGKYSVAITLNGLTSTSMATVIVVNNPFAKITNTILTFNAGSSLALTAQTGTGYLYQWKKDGANISGATNPTYTATTSGSYQIKVSVGTCNDWSAPVTITQSALTATITPSGSTTFIDGGSVMLNANTGAGFTYQWKKGGSNISGATGAFYKATSAGSYTVAVTSSGKTATSASTTVTTTTFKAIVTPASSLNIGTGGSVILNANIGDNYTYQWKKNGVNITGATIASYKATTAGKYQVKITYGKLTDWSAEVTVTTGTSVRIGTSDSTESSISKAIKEEKFDVKIGPNPTTTEFTAHIKTAGDQEVKVDVYDMTGRKCMELKSSEKNPAISFGHDLASGTYITIITQGTGKVVSKIIKIE